MATKYYRIGDATDHLIYSTNEGESWETYKFSDEKVRVLGKIELYYCPISGDETHVGLRGFQTRNTKLIILLSGLMTEPGENTTVFFIFASSMNSTFKHSWILIKVDFRDVFGNLTCFNLRTLNC